MLNPPVINLEARLCGVKSSQPTSPCVRPAPAHIRQPTRRIRSASVRPT